MTITAQQTNSATPLDVSGVAKVSYADPSAPQLFTESLRRTGFGVLTNHPIAQSTLEEIYREWLGFFDNEAKHRYRWDPEKQDGFFSAAEAETAKGGKKRDLKEYFHVFPWGRYPREITEATHQILRTGERPRRRVARLGRRPHAGRGQSQILPAASQMIRGSSRTLLRVLRYPPITGEEHSDAVRAAAHEDINLLTVLPAANAAGPAIARQPGRSGAMCRQISGRW